MSDKRYTVIVSDRAAAMLVNHIRFLARISPGAAKKLHKEIIAEAADRIINGCCKCSCIQSARNNGFMYLCLYIDNSVRI